MRNWLNDARSYMEPVKIGAVMRSGGIGRVVASRSKDLSPGDLVSPLFPATLLDYSSRRCVGARQSWMARILDHYRKQGRASPVKPSPFLVILG